MNTLLKTHGARGDDLLAEVVMLRRQMHLLAEQGALLQMTLDHVSDGILALDRDWLIVASNDAVDRLLDLPLDLVLTGAPFVNILRWLTRRGDYGTGDPAAIAAGLIDEIEGDADWFDERETPDGRVIRWRVREMAGRGRIVTISDVTERRGVRFRRPIAPARRLDALSALAGGFIQDMGGGPGPGPAPTGPAGADRPESGLPRVLPATECLRTLVRRLLDFGGSRQDDGAETDVQALVIRAVDMIRATVDSKVFLRLDLQGADRRVPLGPTEVQQIVTNLVLNAVQAIGDEAGTVVIQVAPVDEDDPRLRSNLGYDPTRAYIRLSVVDDGPGIPDGILPRIFEPFFSTRAAGEGAGLGLAVVHGLVTQAGGWVEAIGSTGARFDVFLPTL